MTGLLWRRVRQTLRLIIVMSALFVTFRNDMIVGWRKRCIWIIITRLALRLNYDLGFLRFLNLCDRWHFALFHTIWKQTFIKQCCGGDTRCTGMNVKVRKTRNKDQVPREKP